MIDEMRVQQILLNFLTNAIKFSNSSDSIDVWVNTTELNEEDVQVIVSVQDYGIGIDTDDLKRLFLPYFKTKDKNSKQRNASSHGLGLSICQKIADCLKGQLLVESDLGQGSKFTLKFRAQKVVEDKTKK